MYTHWLEIFFESCAVNDMLKMIWADQEKYNKRIKELDDNIDVEHWTEIYLLGLMSELDELLSLINWKRNRKISNDPVDTESLAVELADMTKFVMSLWQLWGFSADDMLTQVANKNEMLEFMLAQELREPPTDRSVLICDIDGIIGDWRSSFISYLQTSYSQTLAEDAAKSLMIDTDLDMRYSQYYQHKEEFERDGGYAYIRHYSEEIRTVRELKALGFYVVIVTARPYRVYKRIWQDTWKWLLRANIRPDELHFVGYDRIIMAENFRRNDCDVIMFEDDPNIIRRSLNDKIMIFCKAQPYNEEVKDAPTVQRLENITSDDVGKFLATTNLT